MCPLCQTGGRLHRDDCAFYGRALDAALRTLLRIVAETGELDAASDVHTVASREITTLRAAGALSYA